MPIPFPRLIPPLIPFVGGSAAAADSVVKVSILRDVAILVSSGVSASVPVITSATASVVASPVTVPLLAGAGVVGLIALLINSNNSHGGGGEPPDENDWILWLIYLQLLNNPAFVLANSSNIVTTKKLLKILINRAIEHKTLSAKVLVKSYMAQAKNEDIREKAFEEAGTHISIEILSSFFGLVGESFVLDMIENAKTPITSEAFKKGLASCTVSGVKADIKNENILSAITKDMVKHMASPFLDNKFDEYLLQNATAENLGEKELQILHSLIADKNLTLDKLQKIEKTIVDSYLQLSLRTIDTVNKYSNISSKVLCSALIDAAFAPFEEDKDSLEKLIDTTQNKTLTSIVEEFLGDSRPFNLSLAN